MEISIVLIDLSHVLECWRYLIGFVMMLCVFWDELGDKMIKALALINYQGSR